MIIDPPRGHRISDRPDRGQEARTRGPRLFAATARWNLQRIPKRIGPSSANHLGDACLAVFAANGAVRARTTVTVSPTVMPRCILRKPSADLLANAFDLIR